LLTRISNGNGGYQESAEVEAHQIQAGDAYVITFDGNQVMTLTATGGGTLHGLFASTPTGSHLLLPPSASPVTNIKLIEIRDAQSGTVIAAGVQNPSPPPRRDHEPARSCSNRLIRFRGASGSVRPVILQGNPDFGPSGMVQVSGLAGGTAYTLVVDGNEAAKLLTDQNGRAKLIFSANPRGSQLTLPPQLQDFGKIKLIEIKDPDGKPVLTGAPHC
jgi:hypothetical protein